MLAGGDRAAVGGSTTGVGGGEESGSGVAERDAPVPGAPGYSGEGGGVMFSMVVVASSKKLNSGSSFASVVVKGYSGMTGRVRRIAGR